MARYHFHLVDEDVKLDLRTLDLDGEAEILGCAEQLALTLLRGKDQVYASDPDSWEIRVTNEAGIEVFALPLSEVAGKK
jgi:hypothetical protein